MGWLSSISRRDPPSARGTAREPRCGSSARRRFRSSTLSTMSSPRCVTSSAAISRSGASARGRSSRKPSPRRLPPLLKVTTKSKTARVSIPDGYRFPPRTRQHSPRTEAPERRGYRRPAAFRRRTRPRFRTFRFTFARFFSFRLLRFPIFLAMETRLSVWCTAMHVADPLTLERAAAQFSRWMVLPAVGLAVLGSAVHAALLRLPVVDDAAISIAYGQTLFAGAGLRLTPGSPPVEGFSNPLWVLLLGLSGPLYIDALAFSRWLGILLGALALVFVALAVPAATGRRLRPVDTVGPLLVAASPNYAYWICSGMESGLHALLLAASVWALVRDFRLGRGLTSGLVLAGLALTRPEAPLVILAAAALWASWLPGARRRPGRPEVMLVGVLALVGGLYLLFRWAYFAHLLPNTYFAKQYWNFRPQEYLLGFARTYPLPLAVSSVLGILGLVSRSARRPASLALAFLLCDVVFVWVVKADWMAQWRFLGPLWPMLGVLVGSGLCAIAERSSRASLPVPGPVVPLLACLGTLGLCVPAELTRFDSARRDAGFPATFVRNNALRLRQRLRDLGVEQARVGLAD